MPLHHILKQFLNSKQPVIVYGPAGTGKTMLALEFYSEAANSGLDPVLVATEPGTVTAAEERGLQYRLALTLDVMTRIMVEEALRGKYLVVDSINFHYRSGGWPASARLLGLASSILYERGGIATAQVSGAGEVSGAPYILPWARVLARTKRGPGGLFIVEVLRPLERTLAFRVVRGRIRWL